MVKVETKKSKRIVVTAALPYANGPIHVGHLVEYIETDIFVRFLKLIGEDAIYCCADDTHGTAIEIKASELKITPEELIAKVHKEHLEDFSAFHIKFDSYYTTNSDENKHFADKIYNEAVLLEKYESAGKVTEEMEIVHKRYDVLRTFLWINNIKTFEKCEKDYSTVVYLYEYFSKDLTQKARQNVWSKILSDLKEKEGNNILLIPIAADSDLTSLDSLIYKFNITNYPVVVINEKDVIYELSSVEELRKYVD